MVDNAKYACRQQSLIILKRISHEKEWEQGDLSRVKVQAVSCTLV